MKKEKFPKRIKSIIEEFNSKPNLKRFKYLLYFKNKVLVISRIFFNDFEQKAYIKYSASARREYIINEKFIEALTDIQIEKVNVIRKKLKLKSVNSRKPKKDEFGNIIKKRGMRKNRELSELEFKSMFDDHFISDEIKNDFFNRKDLLGHAEFPKRDFKRIKPEFREVIDEFLSKFEGLDVVNDNYKRNNYGGLSLIVGKTFTNNGQLDPRFKTYKSIAVIHRQGDQYIKVIVNNVKAGKDTIYYLINDETLLKVQSGFRWRNRG